MLEERAVDRLTDPAPKGTIAIENEAHTFIVNQDKDGNDIPLTKYLMLKAPVVRIDTVRVGSTDSPPLTKGTDWQTVDTNGDGVDDGIEFLRETTYPNDTEEFYVDYVAESVMLRFATAGDDRLEEVITGIDGIPGSHSIEAANSDQLDLIGELFGDLGDRNTRTDAEYRTLLRSIVSLFNGRGTKSGMKKVVAIALNIDESGVEVSEDFSQVGFTVTITDVSDNLVLSSLNELVELAKPSGVELLEPPVLAFGGAVELNPGDGFTVASESTVDTLGTGSLDSDQLN